MIEKPAVPEGADGSTPAEEGEAFFATALARRAPHLSARPEREDDAGFLDDLFVRCSLLREGLPEPLLAQQAQWQRRGHGLDHPQAERVIVTQEAQPIGRIAMDHGSRSSLLVDVALLPGSRSTGAGLAMLRAWIAGAEARELPCRLRVLKNNPAVRLYRHLGFVTSGEADDALAWSLCRPLPRARGGMIA